MKRRRELVALKLLDFDMGTNAINQKSQSQRRWRHARLVILRIENRCILTSRTSLTCLPPACSTSKAFECEFGGCCCFSSREASNSCCHDDGMSIFIDLRTHKCVSRSLFGQVPQMCAMKHSFEVCVSRARLARN